MGEAVALIGSVIEGSIAEEAEIEPGDVIKSINGHRITDIFDYRYLILSENITIGIKKHNGEDWVVDIEKGLNEDLGIEFANPMIDCEKTCSNKCIFCFIDQLPKGLRKTLYYKDDDSRLSFLTGNYITMTNMREKDYERIFKYRLAPINVSVHTTDPLLRQFMLGNRFAGNIIENIKRIVDRDLTVNCQVVLCREINDKKHLEKTINDLSSLYPGVNSISVVPAGLTAYREGLYSLKEYDLKASKDVVVQIERLQKNCLEKYGSRIVYPADEFYINAGLDMPFENYYEGFPQIENGVGMMTFFISRFNKYLDEYNPENGLRLKRKISLATGVMAYTYLSELIGKLKEKYPYLEISVFPVENDFFGKTVTVSGLVTGTDIVRQLKGKKLGDELLIPENMLKSGEKVFLDDYTVDRVRSELDVKVSPVNCDGYGLCHRLLGEK